MYGNVRIRISSEMRLIFFHFLLFEKLISYSKVVEDFHSNIRIGLSFVINKVTFYIFFCS